MSPSAPRRLLSLPQIIANALLSHFLFSRLPDNEIITLVDAMESFKLSSGDTVIEQGAVGDYFYIVEEGTYDVLVDDNVVLKIDEVCAAFGELALMHNAPRAASVVATSPGLLWGLDRNTFRSTLAATSASAFDDIKSFLNKVDMLRGLDESQMSTLAQAVEVQTFYKGEIIIRKGDVGEEVRRRQGELMKEGWSEATHECRKIIIMRSYITTNLPLVASLLA